MPADAPLAKVAAVRGYGGEVRLVDGSYDEAARGRAGVRRARGGTLIPPFDDPEIVAGQGTAGPRDRPPGAGRRAWSSCRSAAVASPGSRDRDQVAEPGGARVVGVQAEACAPYVESLAAHRPIGARSASTICDGIAVKRPGELTLPLVERHLDEIVTVSDDEVAAGDGAPAGALEAGRRGRRRGGRGGAPGRQGQAARRR